MSLHPATRFILALVLGLTLLAWAASGVVYRTLRDWFERDANLRGLGDTFHHNKSMKPLPPLTLWIARWRAGRSEPKASV